MSEKLNIGLGLIGRNRRRVVRNIITSYVISVFVTGRRGVHHVLQSFWGCIKYGVWDRNSKTCKIRQESERCHWSVENCAVEFAEDICASFVTIPKACFSGSSLSGVRYCARGSLPHAFFLYAWEHFVYRVNIFTYLCTYRPSRTTTLPPPPQRLERRPWTTTTTRARARVSDSRLASAG